MNKPTLDKVRNYFYGRCNDGEEVRIQQWFADNGNSSEADRLLGALLGQLIVYITYYPHYKETEDAEAILGTFCTTDADNQKVNYFLNEMFGTLVLVFGALCCLSLAWGKQDYAAASIVVGFIVWGLVTSMGGPTGPGLNPARDLMPRLLHAILPIPHKGSSRWGEAWIPVVAPIVGAIIGAWLFVFFFAS